MHVSGAVQMGLMREWKVGATVTQVAQVHGSSYTHFLDKMQNQMLNEMNLGSDPGEALHPYKISFLTLNFNE